MLKALRFRLTLLYLVASLGLVALLGAGTYGMLALYFQRSTDLALQYKMATEFQLRGLTLPAELSAAEQAWIHGSSQSVASGPTSSSEESSHNDSETDAENGGTDDRYDGSLAPVFVVPEIGGTSIPGVPLVNDPAAITAALQMGSDLRTFSLSDGSRLRLLTYRIGGGSVLQVGRLLGDQDRLLSQYLGGLLFLGSIASLMLALASWALAGRSIKPAQRAWDQQQQFISNASHELRTPLTLLRLSADYALHSPSVAEHEKSLRDILNECDYMNRLVEDLLLLSRLDAHRLSLSTDLVPLLDLLGETTRLVEKIAVAKGVSIRLEPIGGVVRGDLVRIRQVMLILLDNALRFTPSGGVIRLGAQVLGGRVFIHVSDNGTGIPSESLPHIFERFYQVPGQPGETRGNGLGLSIARGLVEAHHGKITISSQPGSGTDVQVVLPAVEN